jgi:hypothetical protein
MTAYTGGVFLERLFLSRDRDPQSATGNDDIAAAFAGNQDKVRRGPGLVGRITGWFGDGRRHEPETVDMAITRLAAISPHLLDDIGVRMQPATGGRQAAAGQGSVVIVDVPDRTGTRAPDPTPSFAPPTAIAAE